MVDQVPTPSQLPPSSISELDPPPFQLLPKPLEALDPQVLVDRIIAYQTLKRRCLPVEISEGIEIATILRKTHTGPGKPKKSAKAKVDLDALEKSMGL